MQRTSQAAFAVALCSLALPSAASAAGKTVTAGPPSKPPAGTPKDADFNAFFPSTIKVRQGGTVTFRFAGFHTIDFPKKGSGAPTFEMPSTPVAGVKDAAGVDFWFNGQPSLVANPAVAFGTKSGLSFTGGKDAHSGAPLQDGPPKPWAVKFTKAGTFNFYCAIHPGMKGKITVLGRHAQVPTSKEDAVRAKVQFAKQVANVKKLAKQAPPSGNVIVAGPDLKTGETLFRFTPSNKTVKVGTPVTLTMSDNTRESHTFTFAKSLDTLKPIASTFIAPLPGTGTNGPPVLGLNPQATYPSDPTLPPYDGTQHGNGFLNTGVLDGNAKSPLPQKATVTFSAPGTYQFMCLIHPEMHGKVTVTS